MHLLKHSDFHSHFLSLEEKWNKDEVESNEMLTRHMTMDNLI